MMMKEFTPTQEKPLPHSFHKGKAIVFFDGECGLCHGWVKKLLRWDRHRNLCYAPIQGETAREILHQHDCLGKALSGIWLWIPHFEKGGALLNKSDAIIGMAQLLPGLPHLLTLLAFIPQSWRNKVYDFIAHNRYRLFGKKENACELIPPEQQELFLP